MRAALSRPPPLPFQREDWQRAAFAAVDALGPPSEARGVVHLDLLPCVVLTAQGGGLSRTWALFEPFRLLKQAPRPRQPGAPFVVLTARGGGLSRTVVLFEPFRVVTAPRPAAARHRPLRAALTCTAPSLRRTEPRTGQAKRWARLRPKPVEVQAVGAPRAQLTAPPEQPPEVAPTPVPPSEQPSEATPAPSSRDWPWAPCPLAPVDEHPPQLRRAAVLEHRLWDLAEGNPSPWRRGPAPADREGPTAWPKRRDDGTKYSEFWHELRARDAGEKQAAEEAARLGREAGFLVRQVLRSTGMAYVATLEDVKLRAALEGEPTTLEVRSVEALREALWPYLRTLQALGRPARLPRRKHPKKPPPPEQLGLELTPPAKQRRAGR